MIPKCRSPIILTPSHSQVGAPLSELCLPPPLHTSCDIWRNLIGAWHILLKQKLPYFKRRFKIIGLSEHLRKYFLPHYNIDTLKKTSFFLLSHTNSFAVVQILNEGDNCSVGIIAMHSSCTAIFSFKFRLLNISSNRSNALSFSSAETNVSKKINCS